MTNEVTGPVLSTSPFPVSHLLLSHGNQIFLHIVRLNQFSLFDLPIQAYASPVQFRLKVGLSIHKK